MGLPLVIMARWQLQPLLTRQVDRQECNSEHFGLVHSSAAAFGHPLHHFAPSRLGELHKAPGHAHARD